VSIRLLAGDCRDVLPRCRQDAPLFTAFPPAEPPEDDERMADLFTDMAAD
jgi:hypothetical protein